MKPLRIVLLFVFQNCAWADTNAVDVILERQRLAGAEKIAWIYAGAIAAAGAFIGLGIYFGLRTRKK